MDVESVNIKEHIMALLSLTGLIDKSHIQLIPGGKYYTQQAARDLVIDKYLERGKTEAGIIYKPKKPNGVNYIYKMPSGYYDHYLLMSNNHEFLHTRQSILRASAQASVIILLHNIGAKIDTLRITYNPDVKKKSKGEGGQPSSLIFKKLESETNPIIQRGVPLQPLLNDFNSDYIKMNYNEKEDRLYITSKIFKNLIEAKYGRTYLDTSRFTGVYLTPDNYYIVYQLNPDQEWNTSTELMIRQTMSEQISMHLTGEAYIKKITKRIPGGASILFTNDYDLKTYMSPPEKKGRAGREPVKPCNVYGNCHLIPIDRERSEPPLRIISKSNWEELLINKIYKKEEINLAKEYPSSGYGANAVLPKKGLSYEMLSCNLKRLHDIGLYNPPDPIHFVCYEWQKEAIQNALPKRKLSFTLV